MDNQIQKKMVTIAKVIVSVLMIVLFFTLVFFAYYFIHGSFESMPTAEQMEKARLATGLIVLVLVLAEVMGAIVLKRLRAASFAK